MLHCLDSSIWLPNYIVTTGLPWTVCPTSMTLFWLMTLTVAFQGHQTVKVTWIYWTPAYKFLTVLHCNYGSMLNRFFDFVSKIILCLKCHQCIHCRTSFKYSYLKTMMCPRRKNQQKSLKDYFETEIVFTIDYLGFFRRRLLLLKIVGIWNFQNRQQIIFKRIRKKIAHRNASRKHIFVK